MATATPRRERMSVDVNPTEHRRIKACAALRGTTIRNYILECVRERLKRETALAPELISPLADDPVLRDLWDNPKDATYDKA
ncbi:MAG: hypothetical protein KBD85_05895 [Elusimicrobia bacterium]|nr:hypothetical protein [Elusimicrobiota bacterium]